MKSAWKPKIWISVLLGLFLQSMAFLYLQRLKLFWLYFLSASCLSVIDWYLNSYFSLIFNIVCPTHAYFICKKVSPPEIRKWYSLWWGIPSIYLAIVLPVFLIRSFFYEPFSMSASSMTPYLNAGDHIIVEKYGYGNYGTYGISLLNVPVSDKVTLEKGKVYVFYPPHKPKTPYVKRLVGLPGDRIKTLGNKILINDEELQVTRTHEDPSIFYEVNDTASYRIKRTRTNQIQFDVVVPENQYFFLGDSRDNSSDSRY